MIAKIRWLVWVSHSTRSSLSQSGRMRHFELRHATKTGIMKQVLLSTMYKMFMYYIYKYRRWIQFIGMKHNIATVRVATNARSQTTLISSAKSILPGGARVYESVKNFHIFRAHCSKNRSGCWWTLIAQILCSGLHMYIRTALYLCT